MKGKEGGREGRKGSEKEREREGERGRERGEEESERRRRSLVLSVFSGASICPRKRRMIYCSRGIGSSKASLLCDVASEQCTGEP